MDTKRQILALNAGSSSLKLGLFDWDSEEQLLSKSADWKQDSNGVSNHTDALKQLLDGVDLGSIVVVGHRVVHGGATYSNSVKIDAAVEADIERLVQLAPLHNPAALEGIRAVSELLPDVPQTASFDTAFHSTMAPQQYLYGVPYEWAEKWQARRYGFHGLSYTYCSGRAAEMLGWEKGKEGKLVICHLGNGCSLAAISGGKSVATTMGFTPLDGVMMGTRSGAVDPGLLLYLLDKDYLNAAQLDDALNHRSGLLGISGQTSDMRQLLQLRDAGDQRASLAFDMFCARVREALGAMAATIGGLDALVFTAGIGENAAAAREKIAGSLRWMGVDLDDESNKSAKPDTDITNHNSRIRILVIHTREELVVAREAKRVTSDEV